MKIYGKHGETRTATPSSLSSEKPAVGNSNQDSSQLPHSPLEQTTFLPRPGTSRDKRLDTDCTASFTLTTKQAAASASTLSRNASWVESHAKDNTQDVVFKTNLLDLPEDLLRTILSYVSLEPNVSASQTCSLLNRLVKAQASRLCIGSPHKLGSLLKKYPNVRAVEFRRQPVEKTENWEALEILSQFPGVDSLVIERDNFKSQDLRFIKHIHGLKNFSLAGDIGIDEEGIRCISNGSNLHRLDLLVGFCKLTKGGIKSLGSLHKLTQLRITNGVRFNNVPLSEISGLKNLEEFDLDLTGKITQEEIRIFHGFPRLHTLRLSGLTIDDPTAAALGEIPALKALKLNNCNQLTGTGLAEIGKLTKLEDLQLYGSPVIVDADLDHLLHLKGLKNLIVGGCPNISEEALTGIRKFFLK